jgi:hypothetical protein
MCSRPQPKECFEFHTWHGNRNSCQGPLLLGEHQLAYCDPHTKLVGRSGSPFGARNVGQNKTGAAFFFLNLNNLPLAEIVFGFNFEPIADEFNSLTQVLSWSA